MKKILLLISLSISSIAFGQIWNNLGENGSLSSNPADQLSGLSIVLDSNNLPYAGFVEAGNNYQLNVKKLIGNTWTNVGSFINNNGIASYASIALNSQNVPYVAYLEYDTSTSIHSGYVKKFDGTNWVVLGNLPFTVGVVGDLVLKIDGNNVPYIAYNTYQNPDYIVVKKFNGTSWESLGSITSQDSFHFDFDIDNTNIPYLVYDVVINLNVVVLAKKFNGSTWINVGANALVSNNGNSPSIAFDYNNIPNVAFESSPSLIVKKFNGTAWVNVGNVVSNNNEFKPKIAVGLNNIPVVCYQDISNNGVVQVRKLNGSNWDMITTTATFEPMENYLAIAVGSNNNVYVAHDTQNSVKTKFYGPNLDVKKNDIDKILCIFPNPIEDYLNINLIEGIRKISILDLTGKTVHISDNGFSKINVSHLESGFFIVKIAFDGFEIWHKFYKK